jgi:epoxyqueuosine reductase
MRATPQQSEVLSDGLEHLHQQGLNLQSMLPKAEALLALPELKDALVGFESLLLIGSAGTSLWRVIEGNDGPEEDPIDSHCLQALTYCHDRLREIGMDCHILWHGGSSLHLPVQVLGAAAGWAQRSRMGLSIHGEHGLWFAYRGVLALGPRFHKKTVHTESNRLDESPCVQCTEMPCVSSCPAEAVGGPSGIQASACFSERDREGARCADRCLSRLACPIGVDSQYSLPQIAHHHAAARSLME